MLASFIWICLSVLLRLFIGEHFHETVHQAFCRVGRFFFARRFFLPAASFLPACVHDERDAIPYGAAGQAVFGFFEDSEDAA